MRLHPFQSEAIEALWSGIARNDRQLCVLPTGSGKGEILRVLLERSTVPSLLLLNREKLVTQFAARLAHLNPGVYCSSYGAKRVSRITIASVQSIHAQRIEGLRFIIVDEAHNLNEGTYATFLANNPAKLIGFTATPYNERGLIYGEGKPFSRVAFTRNMRHMIDEGFIVAPVSKCPPEAIRTDGFRMRGGDYVIEDIDRACKDGGKIRRQVADALPRLASRRKCVWICVSIEHAEMVAAEIGNYETVSIIHSKHGENAANMDAFERGPVRHMVSIAMVSEGYDFPAIDAIVLMRPTRSPRLYVQAVGRGLRCAPDKRDCLVLDYGEVIKHLGPVWSPRVVNGPVKKGETLVIGFRVCPECFTMFTADKCECGYEVPERELAKNLRAQAADADLMAAAPEVLDVTDISFAQHKSKAGNECIRVSYYTGFATSVSEYFSNHPFSWSKGYQRMKQLTGWDFSSWKECYDVLDQLEVETFPEKIEIIQDGKYSKIKRLIGTRGPRADEGITDRAGNSQVPF